VSKSSCACLDDGTGRYCFRFEKSLHGFVLYRQVLSQVISKIPSRQSVIRWKIEEDCAWGASGHHLLLDEPPVTAAAHLASVA
jgi:hypothetical protein